jgi:hypothetical protein
LRGEALTDAGRSKDRRFRVKAPAPSADVVDLLMASRRAAIQIAAVGNMAAAIIGRK